MAMQMEPTKTVIFNDVDITYDPNQTARTLLEESETSTRRPTPVDLAWKDLHFTVPLSVKKSRKGDASPPTEKVILKGMSGMVRSGQMLAVMGSSGAGKTSLLNLLAGRVTTSKGAKATGEVRVNGRPRDYNTFKKLAAYVLQDDDMFGELTVEEQLSYAALLRLPANMPKEKKLLRVQKIIQELGLAKVRDTQIGNPIVRGISGGERKRVNIGTELVTDPALIFLDEPTTGLDSFNALNVMTTLRQLASNGRTVVSTIHQPRSSIFALFDQLCLLSEGRVMYFGPAQDAVPYFASLNFKSPAQFNPADFFLDLLSVDPRSPEKEANTKARVEYLGDKHAAQVAPLAIEGAHGKDAEAEEDEQEHINLQGEVALKDNDYQTSWINELLVLSSRNIKLAFRERAANVARLIQVVFFSTLVGLIWLSNGRSDEFNERASLQGVMFFVLINQSFGGVFSVIFNFPLERSIVTRERGASTYRTSAYYLSKTFTDAPKTVLYNIVFSTIVYWTVGFRENVGGYLLFIMLIFLTSFLAESLAISVSVLAGDAQTAAGIIPVVIIISVLFGGFFIGTDELPDWLEWMKYASYIFFAFNAMAKNEFNNTEFGDQILESFNELSMWENIAVLAGMLFMFRLSGYLFLHYLRGPKFLKF